MDKMNEMLALKKWAVVGVTQNTTKFGYKVFKKLQKHGYDVFPVNPNFEEIEGVKCYKSITELPDKIDVVNLIVNPSIGKSVLVQAKELGIKNIWCQPGASNSDLIELAKKCELDIVYDECVLVELGC